MFAKAYKTASQFTQPVVFSMRFFDGTVECSHGAFVILNKDGWIITVKHLFDGFLAAQKHSDEIDQYKNKFWRLIIIRHLIITKSNRKNQICAQTQSGLPTAHFGGEMMFGRWMK